MSECIGILNGGGDCPGLNALIRAVGKAAAKPLLSKQTATHSLPAAWMRCRT